MRFATRHKLPLYALLAAAISATLAATPTPAPSRSMHAAFLLENEAAMAKMMAGMHVTLTGDIDRDFATMMIPHHQGAVDMAVAELRYGSNPVLRRLAQEIIVEQQQEIRVMQMALAGSSQAISTPADTGTLSAPPHRATLNGMPADAVESPGPQRFSP